MTTVRRKQVGVLIGSIRRGSFSRKLAKALIAPAPAGLECKIIEIEELALYNEGVEPAGALGRLPASHPSLRRAAIRYAGIQPFDHSRAAFIGESMHCSTTCMFQRLRY